MTNTKGIKVNLLKSDDKKKKNSRCATLENRYTCEKIPNTK